MGRCFVGAMLVDLCDIEKLLEVEVFYNVAVRLRPDRVKNILSPEVLDEIAQKCSVGVVCQVIRNALNSRHRNDVRLVGQNNIVGHCVERGWAGHPVSWQFWDDTKSNHVSARFKESHQW